MKRVAVAFAVMGLGVAALAQPPIAQQRAPVFRGRIDLVQLDVTVLDRNGQPVRGLTKDDFTLFEDKNPQAIEGFTAVDLPERVASGPAWADSVTPDVTTNEIDNARIFVLVIDDAWGMGGELYDPKKAHFPDPGAIKEMRKTVELFINTLGPQDLAGIVFTGTTAKFSQNLTGDRAKLMTALRAYPDNDSTMWMGPGKQQECLAHKEIVRLVNAVVDQLASLPDRRKSLVYFGGQMPWFNQDCGDKYMWDDVFAAAQQGSVTINPIMTGGLGMSLPVSVDSYLSVAGNTGGYAVVNTNDFAPGMKRIFLENSSYYLLAYQPTKDLADGTFRQISVKVKNRPDVEVVTKKNYWAPRAPKPGALEPAPPPPQVSSLAGLLPDSHLKLRVTAAPFAMPGGESAVVTLALGVKQLAFASRTPEQVELTIRSFTTTGDPKVGDDQVIAITVPAAKADATESRYEVLARIDVAKPGPYHLRLSAHSVASDVRGSVYVDVEVPNFRKDKVSLSGVVLTNALPPVPSAPARLLRDLVPVVPTTERAFAPSDPITAFLRIYQGGADKLAAIPIKVRIQDAAGKSVFDKTESVAADRFATDRAAEYQFRVPLSALTPGDYLLTFEAGAAKALSNRDVRFQVR